MIPLTATSQSFRLTAADVTSAGLDLTAVYFDQLQQASDMQPPRRATRLTSTSSAAVVIAVSSPAADGIIRNIEHFTAYNGTTTTATPELKIVSGAVTTVLIKQALTTGKSLVYEHGTGWQVL